MSGEVGPAQIQIDTKEPATTDSSTAQEIRTAQINENGDSVQYAVRSAHSNAPTIYQQNLQRWIDRQKPVKEKNLKVYRMVAVIAIIAFFPIGVYAFYTSMKLDQEYYSGIERGDLTASTKRALLLDKLLILSFTCCLFTVILTLAIVGGLEGRVTPGNHL